jgi:hypothetical protein
MRRWSLVIAVLLALVTGGIGSLAAQESTPVSGDSPFTALGATQLPLTVAEDGSVEVPAELAAGRYEVTLDNPTDLNVDVIFVMSPDGATAEELQAEPIDENLGVPGWFYDATLAGGVSATAQSSNRAVVELTPGGPWAVWVSTQASAPEGGSGTPATESAPTSQLSALTVTEAGTPSAVADAPTIPTIELVEFDFTVPEGLSAGPQVWKVTNAGEQPHHLILLRSPDPITEGRVEQALQIETGVPGQVATPGVGDPGEAIDVTTLEDVAYAQVLSPGRSEWIDVNLETGYYVLLCFVLDPETGQPHAFQHMIEVFEIGAGDTPGVATPAS